MHQVISPCYIIAAFVTTVNAGLFFPEDLPTALNVAYSRIPSVRSGVDSRLGFGFRIGPNADIQLQWELGPQEMTAPLTASAKRETTNKAKKSLAKSSHKNSYDDTDYEKKGNDGDDDGDEDDETPISMLSSPKSNDLSTGRAAKSARLAATADPDYGVKRLRKTLISLFSNT